MDENKITAAIVEACGDFDMGADVKSDIAFHMLDWSGDLQEWVSFCEAPESYEPGEVSALLMRFLNHVPAHVAAAAKLLTGEPVEDVFEVGAVGAND